MYIRECSYTISYLLLHEFIFCSKFLTLVECVLLFPFFHFSSQFLLSPSFSPLSHYPTPAVVFIVSKVMKSYLFNFMTNLDQF